MTDFTKTPDVAGHVAPQERIKEIFAAVGRVLDEDGDLAYDNSDSDLTATTVKGAIDELADRVAALEV